MPTTIEQRELTVTDYPYVEGLSTEAKSFDAEMLWTRIEDHVVHRWCERTVIWMVSGSGVWVPPLTPADVYLAYRWNGEDWEETDLIPAPEGYYLLGGNYKIQACVGEDNPPPAGVIEAYRRLAEYLAAEEIGAPGATSYSVAIGGQLTENIRRNPNYIARALEYSGAADLLRKYRRL